MMPEIRIQRLHGLEQLRALAIILVLLFHYQVYYGLPAVLTKSAFLKVTSFGWTGVDLFFVLSGYLIGTKLFGDIDCYGRIRFRSFYLNRFFRIVPAYVAAVSIYFIFADVQEGRGLQQLWRYLTFTQNIPIDLRFNTFSHAWSLCVEEHFYLILPALLYLIFSTENQRKGAYILVGLVAAGLLLRYAVWTELVDPESGRMRMGAAFKYIYYPTYARLDGLIIGVGIAALFRYQPALRDRITPYGNLIFLAGLGVLAVSHSIFGGNIVSMKFATLTPTLLGFPLISLGYGLLVVAALSPACFLYRLNFRPTAAIATVSYSVYLVHKMSNHWINTNLPNYMEVNKLEMFLICLAVGILAGSLLYWLVERPFLHVRDRWAPLQPILKPAS